MPCWHESRKDSDCFTTVIYTERSLKPGFVPVLIVGEELQVAQMEIVKVCSRKKVSYQFEKSSFAPGCRSNCNHQARRIFITCDIEGSQLVVQLVCLLLAEQRRKLEYENDNNSCCQFKEIHKIKDKTSFHLLSPLEVWVECGAELQFKQPGKICCQDLHNKQNGVRENDKICLLLNLQRNIINCLHCLHCTAV